MVNKNDKHHQNKGNLARSKYIGLINNYSDFIKSLNKIKYSDGNGNLYRGNHSSDNHNGYTYKMYEIKDMYNQLFNRIIYYPILMKLYRFYKYKYPLMLKKEYLNKKRFSYESDIKGQNRYKVYIEKKNKEAATFKTTKIN